jgi:hypothetical protein
VEQDSQDDRAESGPRPPSPRLTWPSWFGIRPAAELILVGLVLLGSYLLGERYEWRGWQFIVPFVAAAGFALVFGVSMSAVHSLVASGAVATMSIIAFRLGLEAGHALEDPVIEQGFATWVLFSIVIVPVAWLIGIGISYVRRRHAAGPSGP